MKQEKHEIRCFEIEKHLGKYCLFEKSYKNTRTKSRLSPRGWPAFVCAPGLELTSMLHRGGAIKALREKKGLPQAQLGEILTVRDAEYIF